tara:strand:- start:4727 stop:6019 length:1293 start_codon:yes stop_codon:yes gene_type:complete
MNDIFKIEGLSGKQTLSGEIPVHGSKNAALIGLPAALLFTDKVTLTNVPEIEDVHWMTELMKYIGIDVRKKERGVYEVSTSEKISCKLDSDIVRKIRASMFLVGPLLARFGEVQFTYPGGDGIGGRPIELTLTGLEKMGATCEYDDNTYTLKLKEGKLSGADIFLRIPSVGATQILMLSGVFAEGTTTIKNAAMEPEIENIAEFLNACGAKISGVGTTTITIVGTGPLSASGKRLEIIPDRLETGSFLVLGVLAGKDITITNCNPDHVGIFTHLLKDITSSEITVGKNTINIKNSKPLTVLPRIIKTHEYPGFVTDMQSAFVVLFTQAEGKSLVFETIYEERFNYVGNLIQMGAKIVTYDPHRIRIHGKTELSGAVKTSPDIRAGLAYILAAIIAKGESIIHNGYVIDRGYEAIEDRLSAVGVSIERISS